MPSPEEKPPAMTPAEMGRRRWKGTTKAERSEAAKKAANARWGKKAEKTA